MMIGMMWFEDDKRKPLEERIFQAAEYYQKKYGVVANFCLVSMKEFGVEPKVAAERLPVWCQGMLVTSAVDVLPFHLIIGNSLESRETMKGSHGKV